MKTSDIRRLFWIRLFAVGWALALPFAVFAGEATLLVTKIDGTQLSGELVAWDASGLTLRTENESVSIASPKLLHARWRHESPNATKAELLLELVDGTQLSYQTFEVQEGEATITTPLAKQPITLSTGDIEYVQLATDSPQRKNIGQDREGDVLVVRKKKSGLFDNLTGMLGNLTPEYVEFTWDGELMKVKRSKVAALEYFHARKPLTQVPICWLNLRSSGRMPVAELAFQASAVRVRTTGGFTWSFAAEWLQDADFSQGKIAYLSDLLPIEQRWTPRIGLPRSAELIQQHGLPRRDQSFSGSAISLQWPPAKTASVDGEMSTYAKGLSVRSRTESRYRLPKGMRRFITLAGIDPETASQGNVTLEIFADRRSIWQGEIDGGAAPTAIDVALGDAHELRLVVDYGKNLDYGDRLHLAEARLSQ